MLSININITQLINILLEFKKKIELGIAKMFKVNNPNIYNLSEVGDKLIISINNDEAPLKILPNVTFLEKAAIYDRSSPKLLPFPSSY